MNFTYENKFRVGYGVMCYVVDAHRGFHIYEHPDGAWTVADGGTWLPGRYDTAETVIAVAAMPDNLLALIPPVWRADTENRPATMADLPLGSGVA